MRKRNKNQESCRGNPAGSDRKRELRARAGTRPMGWLIDNARRCRARSVGEAGITESQRTGVVDGAGGLAEIDAIVARVIRDRGINACMSESVGG